MLEIQKSVEGNYEVIKPGRVGLSLARSFPILSLVKFQCVSFHMNIIILIKNSIHVYRMDIIITIHYQMNKINWCVKVIVPQLLFNREMLYFFTDVSKGRRINEAFKKRNATQNVLFGKKHLKLANNCKDVN